MTVDPVRAMLSNVDLVSQVVIGRDSTGRKKKRGKKEVRMSEIEKLKKLKQYSLLAAYH
jgi:hypothetical protein